jgi:hypothetical protein
MATVLAPLGTPSQPERYGPRMVALSLTELYRLR